jgi:AhpD family alkylhydroperoxidase
VTRVDLVPAEQAPLLARPYYREDGSASELTRALAQVPEVLEVALPFIGRLYGETSLDLRTKELVIFRVSALNRCRYCIRVHGEAAREAGVSEAELADLAGDAAGFAGSEAALVKWCDGLCAAPEPVADAVAQGLREHFAEHEVVELTLVAGATIMLNRFCTALELT